MERWNRQKKILIAFGIFFVFMFACTFISRVIYASRLVQVTAELPRRMAISHEVEAGGIVRQGQEYAVTALAGLRVETVYVHVGDRVTTETLLFKVDMDDLEKQLQQQELAIQKINLQIQEQEQNQALTEQKRQNESVRAREDYARIDNETRENLKRADHDLRDAEEALEEHRNHPPEGEEGQEAWQEEKEALKAVVEDARRAQEDAAQYRLDALQEAERKISDVEGPAAADNSLGIHRLEIASLKTELKAYRELLKKEGKIYPEMEGIVTHIQVSPGERVPDGAAIVCADLSSPLQFHAALTEEQKKYVSQGSTAELMLDGCGREEVTVDYIAENEMNPGFYDVCIFLRDGVGNIGQSGSFLVKAQSEQYACCIPLEALWEDSNRRSFVYKVSKKSGILGEELMAEKVYVRVLDQNDRYAAIEEGVIDRETELIVDATDILEDRDVVRYKE